MNPLVTRPRAPPRLPLPLRPTPSGNFMLLTEEEDSPLKAIDFGLAVFFDPDKLPRTDLGLEGTPWFMAPETLSSQTYPASDIWAAGIMAYQARHSGSSVAGHSAAYRLTGMWNLEAGRGAGLVSTQLKVVSMVLLQLLSGYLPFDDPRNPNAPALSGAQPVSASFCMPPHCLLHAVQLVNYACRSKQPHCCP